MNAKFFIISFFYFCFFFFDGRSLASSSEDIAAILLENHGIKLTHHAIDRISERGADTGYLLKAVEDNLYVWDTDHRGYVYVLQVGKNYYCFPVAMGFNTWNITTAIVLTESCWMNRIHRGRYHYT
jgi:hypothetical protein